MVQLICNLKARSRFEFQIFRHFQGEYRESSGTENWLKPQRTTNIWKWRGLTVFFPRKRLLSVRRLSSFLGICLTFVRPLVLTACKLKHDQSAHIWVYSWQSAQTLYVSHNIRSVTTFYILLGHLDLVKFLFFVNTVPTLLTHALYMNTHLQ